MLWTAGSEPVTRQGVSEATPSLPFPANERGALRTDPTLRVLDHPRVFALGDVASAAPPASAAAASSPAGALPATAQAGSPRPCAPAVPAFSSARQQHRRNTHCEQCIAISTCW